MRKQLGGGMRQAGIIAAGGIYALENMVDRLVEDHAMARRLAEGIDGIDGLKTRVELIRTNIVFCDLVEERLTPAQLVERAAAKGIRIPDISVLINLRNSKAARLENTLPTALPMSH